jgi:Fe2+ or Zn2+ uptake regulation protein
MYYNTTALRGNDLRRAIGSAKGQDERIYALMKALNSKLTPLEVHRNYEKHFPLTPITSIRRSMNTLTKNGLLIKLETKKLEVYGAPNYQWRAI